MSFQAILEDVLSEAKLTKAGVKKVLKQLKIDPTHEKLDWASDNVTFWDELEPKAKKFATALAKAFPGVSIRSTHSGTKTTVFWKPDPNPERSKLVRRNID